MKNELNSRQWALYNLLKKQGDTWTKQRDIACVIPEYHYDCTEEYSKFHDSHARHLMTADIRAINESSVIQKVIISSGKGIKIANKAEFDRYMRKEIMAAVRRLVRAKLKAKKGSLDGQMRITFGEYERDTIKAFIDSDKAFGERLRAARMASGWTAKKAVDHLKAMGVNIDEPMLSRFENGYCIPNGRTLAKLAQIYDISVESLFEDNVSGNEETSEITALQGAEGA